MTKPMKNLGEAELEIMQVIWKAKLPVTSNFILKKLQGRRKWQLSTLMTSLSRLSDVPEDLWDKPLIISRQDNNNGTLKTWLNRELSEMKIVATYNLLFNASLMVEEGLGYAIGFDKIINTSGSSNLCFRSLSPKKEEGMSIIWKKYQVFSKASEKFLEELKDLPTQT